MSKLKRIGLIGAGVVVGLAIIGSVMPKEAPAAAPAPVVAEQPSEAPATVTPSPVEEVVEETPTMTPADVVDAIDADKVEAFCTAYFALGDYDAALRNFAKGTTTRPGCRGRSRCSTRR